MDFQPLKHEQLTGAVLGAAFRVHSQLGPGLLESAYDECLCSELALRKIPFERQVPLPVIFNDVRLTCGYRVDLVISRLVVVEMKAIETFLPIHEAQLLTYMRLGGYSVGLMINFNVRRLNAGIIRRVL